MLTHRTNVTNTAFISFVLMYYFRTSGRTSTPDQFRLELLTVTSDLYVQGFSTEFQFSKKLFHRVTLFLKIRREYVRIFYTMFIPLILLCPKETSRIKVILPISPSLCVIHSRRKTEISLQVEILFKHRFCFEYLKASKSIYLFLTSTSNEFSYTKTIVYRRFIYSLLVSLERLKY